MPEATPAADSPKRWRQVRALLTASRPQLSHLAAGLYPDLPRVGSTDLLCRPEFLPGAPLALGELPLAWQERGPDPVTDPSGPASAHVRPIRADGSRYASYAGTVEALDRPQLFENRPCYRLLGANLLGANLPGANLPGANLPGAGLLGAGLTGGRGLRLSGTSYFAGMELGHAVAHELAAAWDTRGGGLSLDDLPLRGLAGDPCAFERRLSLVAVTTLTLRRTARGAASFILHWRDPAKVNHAGGMYQVMPVGLFQPVTSVPAAVAHDLDLWRCMAREFSEEFLGTSEDYETTGGLLDYDRWPFYRRLARAEEAGRLTVRCLGVGVDPVTFATDILTVAVFDDTEFDATFGGMVALNAEGRVVAGGAAKGIPFTEREIARLTGGGGRPMQASGSALLQLAWQHRKDLLG